MGARRRRCLVRRAWLCARLVLEFTWVPLVVLTFFLYARAWLNNQDIDGEDPCPEAPAVDTPVHPAKEAP